MKNKEKIGGKAEAADPLLFGKTSRFGKLDDALLFLIRRSFFFFLYLLCSPTQPTSTSFPSSISIPLRSGILFFLILCPSAYDFIASSWDLPKRLFARVILIYQSCYFSFSFIFYERFGEFHFSSFFFFFFKFNSVLFFENYIDSFPLPKSCETVFEFSNFNFFFFKRGQSNFRRKRERKIFPSLECSIKKMKLHWCNEWVSLGGGGTLNF